MKSMGSHVSLPLQGIWDRDDGLTLSYDSHKGYDYTH
jgi:hypothetical protein